MSISREELKKLRPVTKEDDERSAKEVKKEYMQKWNAENKEKVKERIKQYNLEHVEAIKAYTKQYRLDNKEAMKEYDKQHFSEYYKDNKEKILEQNKQYRLEHVEEISEYRKQYKLEHGEEIKGYLQNWNEENKEKMKEYRRENKEEFTLKHAEYLKTEAGKAAMKKAMNKRKRGLGFIPLNKPFPGSHAHHFNKEGVIYIPAELHRGVYHNVFTGKGMNEINRLAFDWLESIELAMPMESWMRC